MYTPSGVEMESFSQEALWWGSRIVAALVIVVVAHFIGKAIKALLAKGLDRMPGIRHHNVATGAGGDASSNVSLGSRLGDVGYWLVLLAGVIVALNVLDLELIVEPLNGMLGQFLQYIPRIVGAVVIFIIGFVLATLARRVVESLLTAANLDRQLERLGLRRLTGSSGVAKAVGAVVFAFVIIPVTIVALDTLAISAISDPATSMLNQILNAIPLVLVAAIILTIAYAVGRFVAGLIEQVLPTLGFDNAVAGLMGGALPTAATADTDTTPPPNLSAETFGLNTMSPAAAGLPEVGATTGEAITGGSTETPAAATRATLATLTPSKVVANVALIAIVLFGAVQAAEALQFEAAVVMLSEVLGLFSRILFGGIIILLGVLIAQLLGGLITRSGSANSRLAGTITRWAAIALAVAIGLRFMGLANEIVIIAFALILGAAAVAAAVAFGIGGIQPARTVLERYTKGGTQP